MLLALVLTAAIGADEPDLKWVDKVAEQAYSELPTKADLEANATIAKLQLQSIKTAKIVPGKSTIRTAYQGKLPWNRTTEIPSREAKQQEIKRAEEFLNKMEGFVKRAGENHLPDIDSPRVASAGIVWRGSLSIVQVIDNKNAIVSMSRGESAVVSPTGGLSQPKAAATHEFWLEHDTTSWSDGATIEFKQPIVFTRNKQYDTAAGSTKTLLVARPLTDAEIQRFKDWKPATNVKKN